MPTTGEDSGGVSPPNPSGGQPTVITVPVNIPLPEKLDLSGGNLPIKWQRFSRAWSNYEIAAQLKDLENPDRNKERRTATLLTCIGPDALDVIDAMEFENDDQRKDPEVILTRMEKYCIGDGNETYERYVFNRRDQETNETIDAYVTALRKLAKTCNYGGLTDSLIRDRIVVGINDNSARKKLLQTSKLTLGLCLDICRSSETSARQLKTMNQEDVRFVKEEKRKPFWNKKTRVPEKPPSESQERKCKFCARQHPFAKKKCPAWGTSCKNCGKPNHFAACCQASKKIVLSVECESEDEEYEYVAEIEVKEQVHALASTGHPNKVFATLSVNGKEEKFQLDSGSTVNIMNDETVTRLCGQNSLNELEDTSVTLVMYNHAEVKPLGKKRLKVVNPKNNRRYSIEFLIVSGTCKSILGLRASEHLQLLTVNKQNIFAVYANGMKSGGSNVEDYISQYNDVFSGEGKLEAQLHLEIDKSVQPVQLPTRRVPIALREPLKQELDRLSNIGVIRKVDTPTDWITALVVTRKKNGKVRLCIDPKPLNEALRRNHYPLPTIDDVLPLLSKARVFTVLDAKNGFWHIQLDEPSSYATTFGTPWGRYRWLRMPFGVSPAPEEFQRRIDIALEGLPGQKAIADDILIFGAGDTDQEALDDHDRNLKEVFNRCRQKGIKLNAEKMQLRQKQVSYMGHIISSEGLGADPNKLKAINDMPPPTDKEGVQRVLGMVNYVQKFAPNLADLVKPLRELVKKENEFVWEEEVHGQCLKQVKQVLTQAPVLKFFDPQKKTVLQCDASMSGLGACLLQDGHPVAYASRALTPTETNYAQIEKELLSIVFGVERFEGYVYGRKVFIDTDHKPLESIMKKSLLSAPKRLQRMLLRLQRYDLEVSYRKGTEMHMADPLSRAYLPLAKQESGDNEEVWSIVDTRSPTEIETEYVDMIEFVPIRQLTLLEIKSATELDEELHSVAAMIKQGWPDSRACVPLKLQEYFPFREELSIQDGVVFKGERIIVPSSLRQHMMDKVHASHLGIQGCLRRAKEAFYWPGIYKQITELISRCSICNSHKPGQQKEPLVCHETPTRPWQSISADLFELNGTDYLVTTDRYSNFFELDILKSKTARGVIDKLKPHLARYGLPERITTDNGPQFDCSEFQKFAVEYQFEHITTSPRYPQSNGKAENSVKTAKSILRKAADAGQDPHLSLLDFRNTPSEGMDSSPAQRLFSPRTRISLPMASHLLQPKVIADVKLKLQQRKLKQSLYYDRGAKELQPLKAGDVVRVRPLPGQSKWFKAQVNSQVAVRSYIVCTEDGRLYRRNRSHLYKVPESFQVLPNEDKVQLKVDTQTRWIPRRPTEETPQLPTELSALQVPTVSQPDPQPASPSVPVPVSTRSGRIVESSTSQMPGALQPDFQPASPSVPVSTRSGRIVRRPDYLRDFTI